MLLYKTKIDWIKGGPLFLVGVQIDQMFIVQTQCSQTTDWLCETGPQVCS